MGRHLRFHPQGSLVEVTARTIQGRFLLQPGPRWNETFVGVLARAQQLFPVKIHGFVCLSNHLHLLLTPCDAHELASFMGHVLANLSKEAARRHDWRGPLFERRYQSISVTGEEAAQVARLRYLLAHGVKENLVGRVEEWPGPHCARNLRTGKPARGVWVSRARYWAARNRGKRVKPEDFASDYDISLAPLPCWADLPEPLYRRRVSELLLAIHEEARKRRLQEGKSTLGVEAILNQAPLDRPSELKRRTAPLVHAASRRRRNEYRTLYAEFVTAFYQAIERLRANLIDPRFPPGAFFPPRAFAGPG